ncbi:MAG: bifunctional aminodeoxychorismate synthase component I/aminotransferase [Comamonas sp. SCN 67-35]|mgnify:FL=1|uniref:chorismate-binding protein n=1 Tax=unclassified Comamonas TaxID=2638500 RepID=UPI00086DDE95|nr:MULTISPECIES: chorismate-binding protein [unclassified Comamonas]MBN9330655.1 chorismate-binding protein [Comamonas sp.]ODU39898.1 MAG: bifunctional aminodeoxychorismate synthase component I/aminotransferase [Comamonas sp. SCN 67-35]OJW97960.1 MAG: bifunctional aminodeoxychorismate synthase component I/aminotransferase [Burkholderiales bacterium 66-26]
MFPTVLIDFTDPRADTAPRLRFGARAPRATLRAHAPGEVRTVLDQVEDAARAGAWVVGQLRYEAAPAFDTALRTHATDGPLAWFAVFDAPEPWDGALAPGDASVRWDAPLPRHEFDAAIGRIHGAIAAGECYQINYTAPLRGHLQGAPHALFAALRRAQPGGYAAYLDMGEEAALSVSPELFFDWHARADGTGDILARPMKGTAARAATPGQDAAQAQRLRASPKERAENVMIVDLLRNDLSRIAELHSVRVPRLFHAQALPTVWQMTSDVAARTRAGTRLADVFGALFPCGSVTGAPKPSAMRLIHALEPTPRGVYCGAIGVVRPDGAGGIAATFNVPIRTVALRGSRATCGIGSGITSGATAHDEWSEWRAKRIFVERASAPFDLLETLALEGGALRHRAEHLARMAQGAAHFGLPWDEARVQACLDTLCATHPQGLWRARLRLDALGAPHVEAFTLQATATPVVLALADQPFAEAHGEFTRHKTTRRAHYAAFAPPPGAFDTVLYNMAGEITESTFGNVAAWLDGRWITPALACGLLPGVGRAVALREGRVREGVLRLKDVPRVERWAFINSLRGWLDARLRTP